MSEEKIIAPSSPLGEEIEHMIKKMCDDPDKGLYNWFGAKPVRELFYKHDEKKNAGSMEFWTERWADWLTILGPWLDKEQEDD